LIVTDAVPLFVSVITCELLLLMATLLKLKLPGFAVKVLLAATALPVIGSICCKPAALSVKRMLPVAPFVDVGVNWTVNEAFWPAAMVFVGVNPLIPKPGPEITAAVMTRLAFPLFVNVTVCVLLAPMVMLLKASDAGEIAIVACVPVPLSEIESGELEASLVTTRLPVTAPLEVGAN
jgi:hypothetical protein